MTAMLNAITHQLNATTHQFVELESAEGRKLISKLLRDLSKPRAEMTIHARPENDWKVEIRKRIKGELGEPDCEVVIRTDLRISAPNDSEYGHKAGDSKSHPVTIPRLQSVFLMFSGDVRTFLELAKNGWHFRARVSRGSISSSEHNIGFACLSAEKGYQSVTLGSETVFVNGTHVCRGTVE